jgi:hypothetical protein
MSFIKITKSMGPRTLLGALLTRVAEPENLKTVPVPTIYLNTVPVPAPVPVSAPVPGHIHAYIYT